MARNIEDILHFRVDISPFLIHLTRDRDDEMSARETLERIIGTKELRAGPTLVSDARFGIERAAMSEEDKMEYFSAICFTETPINEIHSLIDVAYRSVNLMPFGLVFMKDRLAAKGVSPVIYINNIAGDNDFIFRTLCSLRIDHIGTARKLLPLIAVFGQKVRAPDYAQRAPGDVDFRWEREWRFPANLGTFNFEDDDVFLGLCPHEEIKYFERLNRHIRFIDPRRNPKIYATKLIHARQRLDLKDSVI